MINKAVWHPVKFNESFKPIPCKIFLKEKILQNNQKVWKARLVAGGHKQSRDGNINNYSPTAHLQTIFCFVINAAKNNHKTYTLDIAGAYLNAIMPNNIYMNINKTISNYLIQLDDKYKEFLNKYNNITVKLDRALYGCIESAKLWYIDISSYLLTIGFIKCDFDECLFRKTSNGNNIYIVIYVDDFMISSESDEEIQQIINLLKQKYQQLTVNSGQQHSYLGMYFDFSIKGKVQITMNNYIDKLIQEYKINTYHENPTIPDNNNKSETLLDKSKQDFLHSGVAKLQYLATRVKPEILFPVNKLSSKVNKFTDQDLKQFYRILQYLNESKGKGIILETDNLNEIEAYIDASYGTNYDRKSQSGLMVRYGYGPLICKSIKQKIVAKSSTEAELIACSDSLSYIYSIKNILEFLNNKVNNIIIYQDNISTIKLLKNKRPTSQRSKHIDIRYFFLRDKLEEEIELKYCPSNLMISDLLTKYINTKQFKLLTNEIINMQD